jgi:tRNA pseudouridine65 synthase
VSFSLDDPPQSNRLANEIGDRMHHFVYGRRMQIVYQDEYFFVIDKPAGMFVHPPERSAYPTPPEKICLYQLRDLLQREVFPVHRLDAPTSGLVTFAMTKDSTRALSLLFANRQMNKTYQAVARGHLGPEGLIDLPLKIAGFEESIGATTRYRTLKKIELPTAVGKKYTSARYSWMEIYPETGRWHQIRRHFDQIAHPLLGDIEHGDSYHNRFFRDELKIKGLCLRATELSFVHPWRQKEIRIQAPPTEQWAQIQNLFQT